jgi:hypothetical protein
MQTKKICSVDGCTYPYFARGYCASHYKFLYLNPKLNALDKERKAKGLKKPKVRYIKKDVEKIGDKLIRKSIKAKTTTYQRRRIHFIAKKRLEDPERRIFCIFCGKVITGVPSLHHSDGRDGSNLLDESKWFLSHNRHHVFEYHSLEWRKCKWWYGYLERIKNTHPELYKKELLKMKK